MSPSRVHPCSKASRTPQGVMLRGRVPKKGPGERGSRSGSRTHLGSDGALGFKLGLVTGESLLPTVLKLVAPMLLREA